MQKLELDIHPRNPYEFESLPISHLIFFTG